MRRGCRCQEACEPKERDFMRSTAVLPAMFAAIAALVSAASSMARTQDALSIANNDSIYIDGNTFKLTPGKAKGDVAARIRQLGARELGPGAIVFRVSDKLYIVEGPEIALVGESARPYGYDPGDPRRFAYDPARPYAYDPGDPRRFAFDPTDTRCAVFSPSNPYCPLIYNPDRNVVYFNDPDYAQYRLKKIFDASWTATTAGP